MFERHIVAERIVREEVAQGILWRNKTNERRRVEEDAD
jgi:hypothetical protein